MGRWRLSRKILCLALLNLVLLGAVVLAFARAQFRLGTEAFLLGPAQDRIMAIANAFSVELGGMPLSAQPNLFAAYRQRYRADFYLVDPGGQSLAGPAADLPAEVLDRMRRRRPGPPRRWGELPKEGPPPRRRPGPRDPTKGPPPDEMDEPPHRRPPAFADPPPGPGREPQPEPVFLAISHAPAAYWVGVRIPLSLPGLAAGTPGILLIRSPSILNGQIFLDLRLWLGLAFSLMAVSGLCWLPFVRGLTRSIGQMDRVTQQIAEGRFDSQVPAGRRDELGHLGQQINRLALRLQSFVTSQKRFLGDIAHELCAPIARIQFALGILQQKSEEGQRQYVAVLHDEVQEMSGLVNELLSFSKAGMHPESVPMAIVDASAAVRRVVAREVFAGAAIETDLPPGLALMGNEVFLLRALSNVLRNAVRYAASSGPITISARHHGGQVEIRVADCGPGLAEAELEQVFAPFYRPEEARTRETGGAGLGLAIVKTCVEACGGTVSCRNRQPRGLEVIMRFQQA